TTNRSPSPLPQIFPKVIHWVRR
ncbi:MMPL family protein, partial [Vibrio parahaemolyticus V-223/04]